jgi:alkanesulfonate monooxygenase SsuD/methylene tetrahydromethanopterin reductase-like flavin-dependent oxidoreductase (luciferase family)
MDIGLFQLLPAPEGVSDDAIVGRALREADFAEACGFDSVWIAEHHLSSFGLVGAPSVLAAAVAQRTRRIGIGYAVAVVPLQHPVRLAEEIAWLTHLSRGRVLVGLGPGFSPFEFAAYGVPVDERRERCEEGAAIVRGLLAGGPFEHRGRFWTVPPVTLRPRAFGGKPPKLFRPSSGAESLRAAAEAGDPLLLGLKSVEEIGRAVASYREIRAARGIAVSTVDAEIAEFRVLRRVVVSGDGGEARRLARRALAWEARTARRVHESIADAGDSEEPAEIPGGCVGTPGEVAAGLAGLGALGISRVIAWVNFGNLPYEAADRTLELLASEVMPRLSSAGIPREEARR